MSEETKEYQTYCGCGDLREKIKGIIVRERKEPVRLHDQLTIQLVDMKCSDRAVNISVYINVRDLPNL